MALVKLPSLGWRPLTALTTEKSNPEPIHGKNKGGESRNGEEAGGQGAEARKLGHGGSLREEAPEDRGNKDKKRPAGTRRTLEIGLSSEVRSRRPLSQKRLDAFSPDSGRSLPGLRGQGQPEGQMSIGRLVCGYATPHKQVP